MDKYPLNPGHCLILPRRHTPLFWDLSSEEIADLFSILAEARGLIDKKFSPDGYNIGVNVGAVAGQTIDHVHVHLISATGAMTTTPGRGEVDLPRAGGVLGNVTRPNWTAVRSKTVEPGDGSRRSLRAESAIG